MKYFFGILIIFFSIQILNAQEKADRFTIDLGLSHSILKRNGFPEYRYSLDREIGLKLNFQINKSLILSTGIGLEIGEHFRKEEIYNLVWVESLGNYYPYEAINNWKLNYKIIKIPISLKVAEFNSFFDFYYFSIDFGMIYDYDLSEHSTPNISNTKINKHFGDLSFGIGKELLKSKFISLELIPVLGSRIYLSNNNDWQNSYLFYQIKFNINF